MLGGVRGVLVRPAATIADRQRGLSGPVAVVFVLGVVAVAGTLVPGLALLEDHMPTLLPDSPSIALATASGAVTIPSLSLKIMAISLVLPFALWVVTGALVHGLSGVVAVALAARRGQLAVPTDPPTRASLASRVDAFRRTLVAVGWGYVPQLLASLVTAGVVGLFYVAGPDVLPRGFQLTPAGHTVVTVVELPALTVLTHLVGGVSVLWTGYVWVGGLQATRGLSRRVALAVVGPVAVFLLYVSDLAGHLGLIG